MPRGVYPRPPAKGNTKRTTRTLRPGESLPDGKPHRYLDRAGYVRLRWKVGPSEYVEIREHRAVVGEDAEHIHHLDHQPNNNNPTNLLALSRDEHAALHGLEHRKFDRVRAAELYRLGLSTIELGRIYDVHPASISRGLRKAGVVMRPARRKSTPVNEGAVLRMHDTGHRAREIARVLGVTREVVRRVLVRNGRIPHPPGRPRLIEWIESKGEGDD